MAEGGGGWGWVGAVVSILSSLWTRNQGKSTDLGTKLAIEGMRSDVNEMGQTLGGAIVGIVGQIASSVGVVKRFIAKVVRKIYDVIKNVVERIARMLAKIFGPILRYLKSIRFTLKQIYDNVIRPILDFIDKVQAVLRILQLFGVDWAKKLDVKLQQIEEYVLAPYEFLVTKLNEISNWINRIVTLDGLFQRVTLLNSLLRDVGYTNNLWWNSNARPENAIPPGKPGSPTGADGAKVISEMRTHFRTGNAPVSPLIRETVANINLNLKRAS